MTDQPTPETDAKLDSGPQPSSDSPDYARALEIHIHLLRAELAAERAKKSDALIAAVDDLERLRAERDALRAALNEFGAHQGVCPKKYHGMKDSRPCTCGLDAALATSAQ